MEALNMPRDFNSQLIDKIAFEQQYQLKDDITNIKIDDADYNGIEVPV